MDFNFTDEQSLFISEIENFARKEIFPGVEEREEAEELSFELWQKISEMGLAGMCLPEEYGGAGVDALTTVLALEAFGRGSRDHSLSMFLSTHLLLGSMSIFELGNDEQRARYLPSLATGEKIAALALTEPEAGSDATSLKTTAKRDGDFYVLNGCKTFITNAPVADVLVLYATVDPALRADGIMALIVDTETEGVIRGPAFKKHCTHACPTGEIFLENARIPVANRLGEEGTGFKAMLNSLGWERLAFAFLLGLMEADLLDAIDYANQRKQFGRTIGSNQLVQALLAEIKMDLEASRLLAYNFATKVDNGTGTGLDAAIFKTFISEAALRCADKAVQVFGGNGCMREYHVGRSLWLAKTATIGGGTSQMQRSIMGKMLLAGK